MKGSSNASIHFQVHSISLFLLSDGSRRLDLEMSPTRPVEVLAEDIEERFFIGDLNSEVVARLINTIVQDGQSRHPNIRSLSLMLFENFSNAPITLSDDHIGRLTNDLSDGCLQIKKSTLDALIDQVSSGSVIDFMTLTLGGLKRHSPVGEFAKYITWTYESNLGDVPIFDYQIKFRDRVSTPLS